MKTSTSFRYEQVGDGGSFDLAGGCRDEAIEFGPFHLAGRQGPLARDGVPVRLRSKALALLWTLARQAGETVTKAALFDTVWPRAIVADSALAFQVNEIRTALGDDARSSRYIATVHRVGFRFVAPVIVRGARSPEPIFVGRTDELRKLSAVRKRLQQSQRQMLLICGEAGIGKSALAGRFVSDLRETLGDSLLWGRGQCVEQHGGEDFPALSEAVGRLCRQPRAARVLEVLRQVAPGWLVRMRGLLDPAELADLQVRTAGVSRERLLGEIIEALELLAEREYTVLVLEDLHWGDAATIEFLARLGRRPPRGRLLVIGTLRMSEAIMAGHPVAPLTRELCGRGAATALHPGFLSPAEVRDYLAARNPAGVADARFAELVHERSDGHPLYMVHLAEHLEQGRPVDTLPQRLTDLIEAQLSCLSAFEQQVLEAGSVEGMEFTAAGCAAALDVPLAMVEVACDRLVRHGQFVRDCGLAVWPDGTVCGCYALGHSRYAQVLHQRQPSARKARLHRRIGERLVAAYGDRAAEKADQLAIHFAAAAMPLRELEFRALVH